jgi:nucleoside 2-deoxyribosyltransferase
MKAYLSISYSKRKELKDEVNAIIETLQSFNMSTFVFVDQYQFSPSQEKEMMQTAIKEIDDCDILIAETSDKAIGIGIEAGYGKAKGKPVIYLRNKLAEHSTTLSGISDYQIIYADINDLKYQLNNILPHLV